MGSPPLLIFSTLLGRQSNCLLTVEVARFVAERLGRRLLLPPCKSSPLAEQACSYRPGIPTQRQSRAPMSLRKVLAEHDLSRCTEPAAASHALIALEDLSLSSETRNVTCLHIEAPLDSLTSGRQLSQQRRGARGSGRSLNASTQRARYAEYRRRRSPPPPPPPPELIQSSPALSPCVLELHGDTDLRSQLPIRIARTINIDANLFLGTPPDAAAALLPRGDIFLHSAFGLWAERLGVPVLGPKFQLCEVPAETEGVLRMDRDLRRAIPFPPEHTLCFHWRGEDFHHKSRISEEPVSSRSGRVAFNVSGAYVAERVAKHARRLGASNVLVLTNARFEALHELRRSLIDSGLRAESPRLVGGTTFGCEARYVYSAFAEMVACSRMGHFLGSVRSTFSDHIDAMRRSRRLNSSTDARYDTGGEIGQESAFLPTRLSARPSLVRQHSGVRFALEQKGHYCANRICSGGECYESVKAPSAAACARAVAAIPTCGRGFSYSELDSWCDCAPALGCSAKRAAGYSTYSLAAAGSASGSVAATKQEGPDG